jgi:hypothetical protein
MKSSFKQRQEGALDKLGGSRYHVLRMNGSMPGAPAPQPRKNDKYAALKTAGQKPGAADGALDLFSTLTTTQPTPRPAAALALQERLQERMPKPKKPSVADYQKRLRKQFWGPSQPSPVVA